MTATEFRKKAKVLIALLDNKNLVYVHLQDLWKSGKRKIFIRFMCHFNSY